MSVDVDSQILAIPGRQTGHVQLIQLTPCRATSSPDSPDSTQEAVQPDRRQVIHTPIISAHQHPLSCLASTTDGRYIVSSSERGSIFRVWDVRTGGLQVELRRGVGDAVIWGVDLVWRDLRSTTQSADDDNDDREDRPSVNEMGRPAQGSQVELWMVCWSDRGTIHVWGDVLQQNKALRTASKQAQNKNR